MSLGGDAVDFFGSEANQAVMDSDTGDGEAAALGTIRELMSGSTSTDLAQRPQSALLSSESCLSRPTRPPNNAPPIPLTEGSSTAEPPIGSTEAIARGRAPAGLSAPLSVLSARLDNKAETMDGSELKYFGTISDQGMRQSAQFCSVGRLRQEMRYLQEQLVALQSSASTTAAGTSRTTTHGLSSSTLTSYHDSGRAPGEGRTHSIPSSQELALERERRAMTPPKYSSVQERPHSSSLLDALIPFAQNRCHSRSLKKRLHGLTVGLRKAQSDADHGSASNADYRTATSGDMDGDSHRPADHGDRGGRDVIQEITYLRRLLHETQRQLTEQTVARLKSHSIASKLSALLDKSAARKGNTTGSQPRSSHKDPTSRTFNSSDDDAASRGEMAIMQNYPRLKQKNDELIILVEATEEANQYLEGQLANQNKKLYDLTRQVEDLGVKNNNLRVQREVLISSMTTDGQSSPESNAFTVLQTTAIQLAAQVDHLGKALAQKRQEAAALQVEIAALKRKQCGPTTSTKVAKAPRLPTAPKSSPTEVSTGSGMKTSFDTSDAVDVPVCRSRPLHRKLRRSPVAVSYSPTISDGHQPSSPALSCSNTFGILAEVSAALSSSSGTRKKTAGQTLSPKRDAASPTRHHSRADRKTVHRTAKASPDGLAGGQFSRFEGDADSLPPLGRAEVSDVPHRHNHLHGATSEASYTVASIPLETEYVALPGDLIDEAVERFSNSRQNKIIFTRTSTGCYLFGHLHVVLHLDGNSNPVVTYRNRAYPLPVFVNQFEESEFKQLEMPSGCRRARRSDEGDSDLLDSISENEDSVRPPTRIATSPRVRPDAASPSTQNAEKYCQAVIRSSLPRQGGVGSVSVGVAPARHTSYGDNGSGSRGIGLPDEGVLDKVPDHDHHPLLMHQRTPPRRNGARGGSIHGKVHSLNRERNESRSRHQDIAHHDKGQRVTVHKVKQKMNSPLTTDHSGGATPSSSSYSPGLQLHRPHLVAAPHPVENSHTRKTSRGVDVGSIVATRYVSTASANAYTSVLMSAGQKSGACSPTDMLLSNALSPPNQTTAVKLTTASDRHQPMPMYVRWDNGGITPVTQISPQAIPVLSPSTPTISQTAIQPSIAAPYQPTVPPSMSTDRAFTTSPIFGLSQYSAIRPAGTFPFCATSTSRRNNGPLTTQLQSAPSVRQGRCHTNNGHINITRGGIGGPYNNAYAGRRRA